MSHRKSERNMGSNHDPRSTLLFRAQCNWHLQRIRECPPKIMTNVPLDSRSSNYFAANTIAEQSMISLSVRPEEYYLNPWGLRHSSLRSLIAPIDQEIMMEAFERANTRTPWGGNILSWPPLQFQPAEHRLAFPPCEENKSSAVRQDVSVQTEWTFRPGLSSALSDMVMASYNPVQEVKNADERKINDIQANAAKNERIILKNDQESNEPPISAKDANGDKQVGFRPYRRGILVGEKSEAEDVPQYSKILSDISRIKKPEEISPINTVMKAEAALNDPENSFLDSSDSESEVVEKLMDSGFIDISMNDEGSTNLNQSDVYL